MTPPRRSERVGAVLGAIVRWRWDSLRQGSGFGRSVFLRRGAAMVLVGLAALLALNRGSSVDGVMVVAARDLPPGTVVGSGEVTLRELPPQVMPDGAARSPAVVVGRTLAAPVRRGEPLTDVRLTGSELIRAVSPDPEMVSVPVRLADPGMAAVLHPGVTVDVVTIREPQGEPVVLARGARVLAVLESGARPGDRDGRLVLVALDPVAATRVAATSISQNLTVMVH
jgi:pilus assembly protein CpaB